MVVLDFDDEDPLAEENLRATHNWMLEQIEDERVINAFGYALPDSSMNESSVVAYWQTSDEYLTEEQIATREYLRDQFLSNGVTYIIFSLNGQLPEKTDVALLQTFERIETISLDSLHRF